MFLFVVVGVLWLVLCVVGCGSSGSSGRSMRIRISVRLVKSF